MLFLATMLAGRYGPALDVGPVMRLVFVAVVIVVVISLAVNRKKLDKIDNEAKGKNEAPKIVGGPWKCPKCGEMLEPQFNTCWKCGTAQKNNEGGKFD